MVVQFPRIPWKALLVLGLAGLGYLVLSPGQGPANPESPQLAVRVIGWTNPPGGRIGMALDITNPSRWTVTRHAEYELNLGGLGSRAETLLPARGLGPASSERVVVPWAPGSGRWAATFRFTGVDPHFNGRAGLFRRFLDRLGFKQAPRSLPPGAYVPGEVRTPWFSEPPTTGSSR